MELNNANGIEALYVHGSGTDQPIEKIRYVGGADDRMDRSGHAQ